MSVKVMMEWDILEGKESEYYDFVVNEFIPRMQRIGFDDLEFFYTTYGDAAQIQASGVAETLEQAQTILDAEEWEDMTTQLQDMVEGYTEKVIPATGGFQL